MPLSAEEKIRRSMSRLIDKIFQLNEVFTNMKTKDQDTFIEEVMSEKKFCKNKILKNVFALEPLISNLRDTVNGEQKKREPKKPEEKVPKKPKAKKEVEESKTEDPPAKPTKRKVKKEIEESKSEDPDPQPKPKRIPKKELEESKTEDPDSTKAKRVLKKGGEKTKKATIPSYVKTLVWNQYVGEDMPRTRCLCCRKAWINYQGFHCGHVIAEANGGDLTITNLRPICAGCNLAMKTENMQEFAKRFFGYDMVI